MQIDIQSSDFSLTDTLRIHAERRLRFALTRCHDHIQRVVMRLSDIKGPRGRADKHCHLRLVLAGLPDVVIEDIETDLYVAINRATDHAGRTLARKIERQHLCSGRVSHRYRARHCEINPLTNRIEVNP